MDTATTNPIPSEITVEHNGEKYIYKIPSVHEEIRIGVLMDSMRRRQGGAGGDMESLDNWTRILLRACVNMEVLLKKASVTWPFTVGTAGPAVDSSKFPENKISELIEVQIKFDDLLSSFRAGGNPDQPPITTEAVVSQ